MVLPMVERLRRRGLALVVPHLRRLGRMHPSRSLAERARLRRAIAWLDARCPGGPNCYRRALLEIALDRDAARLPLALEFRRDGDKVVGHAELADLTALDVATPAWHSFESLGILVPTNPLDSNRCRQNPDGQQPLSNG